MTSYLFKSLAGQTAWEVCGKIFRFLTVILAARYLGAAGFGSYALVVTFVEIMNVVADFKLEPGMVRQISRGDISEQVAFGNGLSLKVVAGIISTALAFPLFLVLNHTPAMLLNLAFAASGLFLWQLTSLTRTVFQLHGVLEKFSMARAVSGLFLFTVTSFLIFVVRPDSVHHFLAVYAASFAVEAIISLWLCASYIPVVPARDWGIIKVMIREGLFFSVMNGFVVFYYKIDTLLMEVFRGASVLGLYNAAYRLLDVCMFVPMVVTAMFYPAMLKRGADEPAGWSAGQKAMDFLTGFAIPFALFLWFAKDLLIGVAYGPEFTRTARLLGILAGSIIFLYPSAVMCQALIVASRERVLMIIHASTAALSVLLYCFAINSFGPEGAAWTTVLLQALSFAAALASLLQAGIRIDFSTVPVALLMSAPLPVASCLLEGSDLGNPAKLSVLAMATAPVFIWLALRTLRGWSDAAA